jgi:hypothetical protein
MSRKCHVIVKIFTDWFITPSLKFSKLYIILSLRKINYGKNILESAVVRSTKSSSRCGEKLLFEYKAIYISKVAMFGKWQVIN